MRERDLQKRHVPESKDQSLVDARVSRRDAQRIFVFRSDRREARPPGSNYPRPDSDGNWRNWSRCRPGPNHRMNLSRCCSNQRLVMDDSSALHRRLRCHQCRLKAFQEGSSRLPRTSRGLCQRPLALRSRWSSYRSRLELPLPVGSHQTFAIPQQAKPGCMRKLQRR